MEIQWQAPEYEYIKKSPDWFWVLWIISIGIIVVSIIYNNILFAILVFMISFALSIQATKKPKIINCKINSKGINTPNKKYLFENLEFYNIKTNDTFPRIILKSKKTFMPLIIIPFNLIYKKKIDDFLNNYLEKKELEEPFLYQLTKYF